MFKLSYTYKAKIISVYDGDTVRADIDLGFGIENRGLNGKGQSLRLYGINAPEMRGEQKKDGVKSRDRLRELILGKTLIIQTIKDKKGKYGRYLVKIQLEDGTIVNDLLVSEGLAVYKDY
jgi:micrococcal nuclease